jgi:hypothetical protein
MIEDWLFHFRIKKGTRAKPPDNLVFLRMRYNSIDGLITFLEDKLIYGRKVSNYYSLRIIHPMCEWLLHCEGPWRITVDKKERQIYIAFARKTDAAMFRIMSA